MALASEMCEQEVLHPIHTLQGFYSLKPHLLIICSFCYLYVPEAQDTRVGEEGTYY